MADSSVIREFLVALGFKTDESALKKFDDGISRATKTVLKLGAAIEATALTVAAGVSKFASNLEALYFASIKTGDSAENLKAFDRAAQNLGTEAGEALESVQGLARFLRNNPGGEGLLGSLGVQTRNANGQLRDTTDMLLGLAKQFSSMPYYLAHQYAGIFGISEDTLRAMRSGGFEREVTRMREQMKNTGLDQATKDAHRFMMELRGLVTQLEAFGVRVYDALSHRLGGGMSELTEWLRANGPMLASRVAEILLVVIDLAERIGSVIAWIVSKFIQWDEATGGWSTRLLGLLIVLKFFGGTAIIGGVLKLAAAFVRLGTGMLTVASAGTGLLGLLGKLGVLGATAAGSWFAGKAIYEHLLPADWKDKFGKAAAVIAGVLRSTNAKQALAINDPMTYLRLAGWSKEQAAGILANLQAESGMNPHAVGDHGQAYGLAQWHAPRQAEFAKFAGHDIRQSTAAEQLDFVTYEMRLGAERVAGALLAATRNARQAGEVVSRHYERPAMADAEAARRAERAVKIAQETTINVHGSSDPLATARETAEQQRRVNAELTRNFQVVAQ